MKIVFFGEDGFSCIVLESLILANHDVVTVYCPEYKNNIHQRLKSICKKYNLSFIKFPNFSDTNLIDNIKSLNIDLIVVCHFKKILKKKLIDIPKLGCINLHPSLLPKYRGMSPQHWPIINGDDKTGVTVHYIDEGIDTGDIILQKEIDITEDMYVADLQNEMKKIYSTIVKDAIDMIIHQNRPVIKQNHLIGSYYGKLSIEDCQINDFMGVKSALNLIKGVSFPYHGARYKNFIIWKAKIVERNEINILNKTIENSKIINIEGEYYLKLYDGLLKIEKSKQI